jgi:hypothetical protein
MPVLTDTLQPKRPIVEPPQPPVEPKNPVTSVPPAIKAPPVRPVINDITIKQLYPDLYSADLGISTYPEKKAEHIQNTLKSAAETDFNNFLTDLGKRNPSDVQVRDLFTALEIPETTTNNVINQLRMSKITPERENQIFSNVFPGLSKDEVIQTATDNFDTFLNVIKAKGKSQDTVDLLTHIGMGDSVNEIFPLPGRVETGSFAEQDWLRRQGGIPEPTTEEWQTWTPEAKNEYRQKIQKQEPTWRLGSEFRLEENIEEPISSKGGATQFKTTVTPPHWVEYKANPAGQITGSIVETATQLSQEVNSNPYVQAGIILAGIGTSIYGGMKSPEFAMLKNAVGEAKAIAFDKVLSTGLDKWLVKQGNLKGMDVQSKLGSFILNNRDWLVERARNNYLNRIGRTPNVGNVGEVAVQDTISDFENMLLPKFTPGGSAVPGQTVPLSQMVAAGKAELTPTVPGGGVPKQPSIRLKEIANRTSELNAELTSTKTGRPTKYITERRIQVQKELDSLYKEADTIQSDLAKTVKNVPVTPEVTRESVIKALKEKGFDGTADRLQNGKITLEQAQGELAGTLKPDVNIPDTLRTANAADVIADIKARGFDKQTGYGEFVKARALQPELDMKEFSKVYDSVSATPFKSVSQPSTMAKEATAIPTIGTVQTGLPGIGKESAQAEMLGEFSGKTGAKPGLFDVEALKKAEAAKPLPGQEVMFKTPETSNLVEDYTSGKVLDTDARNIITNATPDEIVAIKEEIYNQLQPQVTNDIQTMKEVLANDPVANYRITIGGKKVGLDSLISIREGSFPDYLTVKQAEALYPGHKFSNLTKEGKVARDAALDKVTKDLGMDYEAIINRIEQIRIEKRIIREAKSVVGVPVSPEVKKGEQLLDIIDEIHPIEPIPIPDEQLAVEQSGGVVNTTETQSQFLVKKFGEFLLSPDALNLREITTILRKSERAARFESLTQRLKQLESEGKLTESETQRAIDETMSGKLPDARNEMFDGMTNTMRDALFAHGYFKLKDNMGEYLSFRTALTNALAGKSIPRERGIGSVLFPEGGSAYDRLAYVFADQMPLLEKIDASAKQGKGLRDIIEAEFTDIPEGGIPPRPVDQTIADYLRSLPTISRKMGLGEISLPQEMVGGKGLLTAEPTGNLGLQTQGGQPTLGETPSTLNKLSQPVTPEKQRILEKEILQAELAKPPVDIQAEWSTLLKEKYIEAIPLWQRPVWYPVVRVIKEVVMSPVDIGGFIKANLSSFDMSYWRQIMKLIPGHPAQFAKSNVNAWAGAFSQKNADAQWQRIIHDPDYPELYSIYDGLQNKSGRDFLRPLELKPGTEQWKGTEEFGYLTKERLIPKLTSNIPSVKISNRGFISGINSDTWGIYKDFYRYMLRESEKIASGEKILKEGEVFDIVNNMDAEAKYLADWTGRASLGKFSQAGPILGNLLYAPRNALGNLISPRHLFSTNPYVRKQAWKDAVLYIGMIGGVVLAGKRLGWWDVETDRTSSDYMKIRIGNMHIDTWGGTQQFVVFFSRLIDLMTTPATGKPAMGKSSVTGQEYPLDFNSLLENFAKSKEAPLMGLFNDYMTGKNFQGEKINVKDPKQWVDRFAPMSIQDLIDAMKENPKSALYGFPLSFSGMGVQTYTGDWNENFKKLGLPKYAENLDYGLAEPVYDIKDWWSDTSKQFRGVDPATLTEQKGFKPVVKAVAEALQIKDTMSLLPNEKLININIDPSFNKATLDTYIQKWQAREKVVKSGDEEALKKFDANPRNSGFELGNISQSDISLLSQYHALKTQSAKNAFLLKNPSIGQNPRQQYLIDNSGDNAKLSVFGQEDVLTPEAYKAVRNLISQYDIPGIAIDDYVPPEDISDAYFQYLDALKVSTSSGNAILAKNKNLALWLEKKVGTAGTGFSGPVEDLFK